MDKNCIKKRQEQDKKKHLKDSTLFTIPTNELYQRIYACVGGCCSPPGVVEGRAVGLAVDFVVVVVVFVDVVFRVVDVGVIVVLGGGNDSLTTIVILGSTGSILTFHSQKPSL